ncbi:MAG: hypothetical protein LUH04_13830 [Clostridium sp.]|nr:hypothetical protein [Clostridium sp.]
MDKKQTRKYTIGFSRMEKKYEWKDHVIFMGLLLALAVWVNRGIEIRGLYMDDLYFWSCYGEQSFLEYVFPMGSTRFRFLYYLAAWLEMAVVRNHTGLFVPINILLNAAVSWMLYSIGRRLANSKGVGFLCGAMFLVSRMAYYQIGQVLGLMETMALWMAILILWYLYRYLNEEGQERRYFIACGLYFGVCFVHERYMALIPLFFMVLLFKGSRKLWEWLAPAISFLLVQLIRALTIGTVLPAGTGGTQVADTLSISRCIRYALSQAAYVFGVNAGPEHLNGLPWSQSPWLIRGLVILADLMVAALTFGFLIRLFKSKKEKRRPLLKNAGLFLVFLAMCIASSSVTIRVEMRWVYVSLAAALLFMAWMYGVLTEDVKRELYLKRLWPWGAAFICYVALMLPVELFYRGYYPQLYLWPDQLRYNSLAEETYGKYGDSLFGKTIYIIGDSYEMSDFTANTFFKVFDKERTAQGTRVVHIKSIRDFGLVTDGMLVLREDPENNAFQDITGFVRELKLKPEYGYYRDGWMDEHAEISVMAGSTGSIDLEIMYPGLLSGGETSPLTREGWPPGTIAVNSSVSRTSVHVEPWQTVKLKFDYNFYMQDAQEQRGADRLAAIVNIKAD